MTSFLAKLQETSARNDSLVCVGLDSDLTRIPSHISREKPTQFVFNRIIVDATYDLVCAYKPNIAFYEARGKEGIEQLKLTITYISEMYPHIPVILDAKRGDIGSTNLGYVHAAFDYLGADAITVIPYLGREALLPYLQRSDKGVFVMCRSSNSGAGEFQDLLVDDTPLYQVVARQVSEKWNENGNCGLVVGATYPEELAVVRGIVGNMLLLVPGIGTQGGDIEKTVKAGVDQNKEGIIVNASRSIIFASQEVDFADKARVEAQKIRDTINLYRRG